MSDKAFPPHIPGPIYGVAYEDAMGGVSVTPCLEATTAEDYESLLEEHPEGELVAILSINDADLMTYAAAPHMFKLLQGVLRAAKYDPNNPKPIYPISSNFMRGLARALKHIEEKL